MLKKKILSMSSKVSAQSPKSTRHSLTLTFENHNHVLYKMESGNFAKSSLHGPGDRAAVFTSHACLREKCVLGAGVGRGEGLVSLFSSSLSIN